MKTSHLNRKESTQTEGGLFKSVKQISIYLEMRNTKVVFPLRVPGWTRLYSTQLRYVPGTIPGGHFYYRLVLPSGKLPTQIMPFSHFVHIFLSLCGFVYTFNALFGTF